MSESATERAAQTVRQGDPGTATLSAFDQAQGKVIKLQAEAFTVCNRIDEAEYQARIKDGLVQAKAELAAAQDAQFIAEANAKEAVEAHRAQEDRFREFAEYARLARIGYERVKGKGSAKEQTDALVMANAAASVLETERVVLDSFATGRDVACQGLDEYRDTVIHAENMVAHMTEYVEAPGRAEYSQNTCALNSMHMLRHWDHLTPVEQQRVKQAQLTEITISGLLDEVRKEAAQQHERKLREDGKLKQNLAQQVGR